MPTHHIFLAKNVQCLTTQGVHCLTTEGVHCLPTERVHCLTIEGVRCLTTEGVHCLTTKGVHCLTWVHTSPIPHVIQPCLPSRMSYNPTHHGAQVHYAHRSGLLDDGICGFTALSCSQCCSQEGAQRPGLQEHLAVGALQAAITFGANGVACQEGQGGTGSSTHIACKQWSQSATHQYWHHDGIAA